MEGTSNPAKPIKISESFEIKTKLKTGHTAIEVKSSSVNAHLDLGFSKLRRHALNPYLIVNFPRKGQIGVPQGSTAFGSIFHYNPKHRTVKLTLNTQLKAAEGDRGTQVSLRKNLAIQWRQLSFSLYDDYSFNQGRSVDTRISVGANTEDHNVTGFFEADVLNLNWMTGVTYGFTVNPSRTTKLFYLCNRFFEMNTPVAAYGFEYSPSPYFGLKSVVIPWARYSAKFSSNFNENVGASLILDYLKKARPSPNFLQDVNFGLQIRVNS